MELRSLDKRLMTILLIVFVQMVGAGMILPILPLYAKNEFSMSPTEVSLLVASFYVAQFVGGPILGRWSDKAGRVPVLIVSQIGTVIAFIAFGLATAPWMLFAARIFDGLTGGNIVVAQAYVTDVTPKEHRARALGLVFAMFGLAFFVGPVVGGMLVGLGPRVPYFVAAGAAAVVVLLTVFTLDESMTAAERAAIREKAVRMGFRAALAIRPLMLTMALAFLAQFALGIVIATFALFGEAVLFDSNAELGVGLLLTFVGLSQIVTQTSILPRALARLGENRLVSVGVGLRTLGLVFYAFTVSPIVAAMGSFFFAMGGGLTMPPTQSIATKTVGDSMRGGVLGAMSAAMSLGFISSMVISGMLFTVAPHLPNQVALGASILALVPAFALRRWAPERDSVEASGG
jgi:DHA1 family tetracycline resistance protein-like MFS transporter